jgi:hypothetical protein
LAAVVSTLGSLLAFAPKTAAAAGTTDLLVGDSVMAGMSSSVDCPRLR